MVKKVIATFSDKKALKILGLMAGIGGVFCIAALLLPSAVTTGAGDWADPAYFNDAALLVSDQMRASFVLGVCCTLFVSAQTCLVWRYAVIVRRRRHRLAITLVAAALCTLFALMLASLEIDSYNTYASLAHHNLVP